MSFPYLQAGKFMAQTAVCEEIIAPRITAGAYYTKSPTVKKGLAQNQTPQIADWNNFLMVYASVDGPSDNDCVDNADQIIAALDLVNVGDSRVIIMGLDEENDGEFKLRFQGTGVTMIPSNPPWSKGVKIVRMIRTGLSTVTAFYEGL